MSGVDERVERVRREIGVARFNKDGRRHTGKDDALAALDSLAAAVADAEQRAAQAETDPELPDALAARVATWLTANEVDAEAVRWGRFPLGMVNLWIERALHTERSNDPDYSPAYQDEYQRLWHEAAARVVSAEQRADEAEKALRQEFFAKLPDLDYEKVIVGSGDVEDGGPVYDWAWAQHPWFALLGLTRDECVAYLCAAAVVSAEPTEAGEQA